MPKRVKLLSLLFLALFTVFASVSHAWPECGAQAAYYTTLYSDATHQTQVGYIYPECHPYYCIWYHLVGTYSQYGVDEYAFTCVDGYQQEL
jgi:hypothetical protein